MNLSADSVYSFALVGAIFILVLGTGNITTDDFRNDFHDQEPIESVALIDSPKMVGIFGIINDTDGDGINDSSDLCQNTPEDNDGVNDGDGCPESDADGDGILDENDACPTTSEDDDGFQDNDGCPEEETPTDTQTDTETDTQTDTETDTETDTQTDTETDRPTEPPSSNTRPNADAGDELTVTAGETVELDATGSSDPDGDSLRYTWKQVYSADPDVTFEDPNTATPVVTTPTVESETEIEIRVVVSDGNGGSDSDIVNVLVQPPSTVEPSTTTMPTPTPTTSATTISTRSPAATPTTGIPKTTASSPEETTAPVGTTSTVTGTPTTVDIPSQTATPVPSAPPVATTTTADTNEGDSVGLLPLLGGGGLLVAGLGGLLYAQRRGHDDPDERDDDDGPSGDGVSGNGPSPGVSPATDPSGADRQTAASESDESTGTAGDGFAPPAAPDDSLGPPADISGHPDLPVTYGALTDEEPIGAGGSADVIRATLITNEGDHTLAVKKPRLGGTLHTDIAERLLAEAETWDQLDDHEHIVGIVDYGAEPMPWIAMEYMDGGDLGTRHAEMGIRQRLWTALTVCEAVQYAHRHGVAHLDLKPENVLFREVEGAWDVPKVADWGLSQHLLAHSKSVEGMSPPYAAPEQFDNDLGDTDNITDIYQLGAVFYEVFTGRPPFEGQPANVMRAVMDDEPAPPSEIADVPETLDGILLQALAKERGDRYDSVIYLRDELQELYDEL